jgi:hypothetical protein
MATSLKLFYLQLADKIVYSKLTTDNFNKASD